MMIRLILLVLALPLFLSTTFAQRPVILTEEGGTLGAGHVVFGVGIEYFSKHRPPEGNFPESELRLMVASSHMGVAENVDFNLDWRGGLFARFPSGASGFDWGDLVISSKIRILRENDIVPALSIRSSVKLPNTSYFPYKLGSDQTDYFLHALATKQWSWVRTSVNLGFGIVGDPLKPGRQDDLYMFSGVAIFPFNENVRGFVELNGFKGHLEYDKVVARVGTSVKLSGLTWSAYSGFRLTGDNKDFGTAFESSEDWSIALFVQKDVSF
jgi:hypothetical protein